jgi:3D (Asp-Asp-Asp) domain-containing protein
MKSGAAVAIAGIFALVNTNEASAQEYAVENWEARTVNQIAEEIEEQMDEQEGTISYTFQWGDTLWGISEATDISVDKLVQVNDIDDRSLIQVGSTIYLSEDASVISVQNDDEVVSYDISEEEVEETETPEEVEESVQEAEEPEEEVSTSSSEEAASQNAPGNLIGTFEATAYAVGDGLTPSTVTANGTDVANSITDASGNRVIAVDPAVIPMNSTVYVELPSGESFYATAADTGSAINGNKIDILMSSPNEAINFGRQSGIRVYSVN